jgi:hypothetical protein
MAGEGASACDTPALFSSKDDPRIILDRLPWAGTSGFRALSEQTAATADTTRIARTCHLKTLILEFAESLIRNVSIHSPPAIVSHGGRRNLGPAGKGVLREPEQDQT